VTEFLSHTARKDLLFLLVGHFIFSEGQLACLFIQAAFWFLDFDLCFGWNCKVLSAFGVPAYSFQTILALCCRFPSDSRFIFGKIASVWKQPRVRIILGLEWPQTVVSVLHIFLSTTGPSWLSCCDPSDWYSSAFASDASRFEARLLLLYWLGYWGLSLLSCHPFEVPVIESARLTHGFDRQDFGEPDFECEAWLMSFGWERRTAA
jgi:hypothetical protein